MAIWLALQRFLAICLLLAHRHALSPLFSRGTRCALAPPSVLSAAHTAEVCLRWVSIGILIFMTVELALKLLVFGPAYYTTSWFHTLDVGRLPRYGAVSTAANTACTGLFELVNQRVADTRWLNW